MELDAFRVVGLAEFPETTLCLLRAAARPDVVPACAEDPDSAPAAEAPERWWSPDTEAVIARRLAADTALYAAAAQRFVAEVVAFERTSGKRLKSLRKAAILSSLFEDLEHDPPEANRSIAPYAEIEEANQKSRSTVPQENRKRTNLANHANHRIMSLPVTRSR